VTSPGFYTQKCAKHDGKIERGRGSPHPFLHPSKSIMGEKTQGGGGDWSSRLCLMTSVGGLVLEALSHDSFFYKRTPLTLPISFFTPSKQADKQAKQSKQESL